MQNDDNTLVPRQPLDTMPAPADLRQLLLMRLEQGVQEMRQTRGEVHQPEDTYPLQRALGAAVETLGDYGRAFADAARVARQIAEEELVEAVGEQDGIPNGSLVVPDARGDVRIAPDYKNEYAFDLDGLKGVVAARWATDFQRWISEQVNDPREMDVETYAMKTILGALEELVALGSFLPGVRAVDAYAKHVARQGNDDLSAVVRGTKTKARKYKGVKITREH